MKRVSSLQEDQAADLAGTGESTIRLGALGPPIDLGASSGPPRMYSVADRDPQTEAERMRTLPPDLTRAEWMRIAGEDARFLRTLGDCGFEFPNSTLR